MMLALGSYKKPELRSDEWEVESDEWELSTSLCKVLGDGE
jgi:hypothetical protein